MLSQRLSICIKKGVKVENMTLVVAYSTGNKITAVADSRISRGDTTATDAGAKLFVVPIVVKSRDDDKIPPLHHSVGFAFAGSTLIANNVQNIASSVTQELYSDSALFVPSLRAIALLYAAVAEYVTKDMNSRLNSNFQTVQLLIFGGCLTINKLALYLIQPTNIENAFSMKIEEFFPVLGTAYSIGSGGPAFRYLSEMQVKLGNKPIISETFHQVMKADWIEGVGGYTQMIEAGMDGAAVVPILEKSQDNPELVALTFLGFDTSAYGAIDGLHVGKRAVGFGAVEEVGSRAGLRAQGLDPDDPNITIETKNLIRMEEYISYARFIKCGMRIGNIVDFKPIAPRRNERCLIGNCTNCGKKVPFCRDKKWARGSVIVIEGDGGIRIKCPSCATIFIASPAAIKSVAWFNKR